MMVNINERVICEKNPELCMVNTFCKNNDAHNQ